MSPLDNVEVTGFCWLWTGSTHKGYGAYSGTTAHRAVYLELIGPIPRGLELDHLCRVTLCVNPDHLEPVTRLENIRRREVHRTACVNGHPYTPENTYRRPTGFRDCRACIRGRVAAYKARKAVAA